MYSMSAHRCFTTRGEQGRKREGGKHHYEAGLMQAKAKSGQKRRKLSHLDKLRTRTSKKGVGWFWKDEVWTGLKEIMCARLSLGAQIDA